MIIHPVVVHFPIALLIVGFLFATLSVFCKKCNKIDCTQTGKPSCIQKVAYWLLLLGALGAVGAVLSGTFFTHSMTGPLGELRDTHQMLAISTMTVSLIAAAVYTYYIYKAPTKEVLTIGYILYVVSVILVSITGHYGGEIVYMFK